MNISYKLSLVLIPLDTAAENQDNGAEKDSALFAKSKL